MPNQTPFWLILTIESHSSSLVSSIRLTFKILVLLTSTSRPLNSCLHHSTSAPIGRSGHDEMHCDGSFAAGLLVDIGCGPSALIVEDITDYEFCTFSSKQARLGCALPPRPTGNQSNLPVQSVHSINPLARSR